MQNMVTRLFNPEEALERLGNDTELLKHLVFTFQNDFSRQRDGLEDAIGSGNLALLKKELHSLKGSSAAVGASGISEAVKDIEQRIASGQAGWSEAVSASRALLQSLQTVQQEFRKWMEATSE